MLLRIVLRLAIAAAVLWSTAKAGGYDDYAVGMDAANRGDDTTAIDAFTKALADPNLAASLKSAAYQHRAIAYLREKQCDAAISDASAVLATAPQNVESLGLRAVAYDCDGALAEALHDASAAIAISPVPGLYRERGDLRWRTGDFADAASDFDAALKLQPKAPYVALWLALSQLKLGTFDANAFSDRAADLPDGSWPGPVVKFYLGREKTTDLYADAASGDDQKTQQGRKCEADFYLGEWQLAHNDAADGQILLKSAAANCPPHFIEAEAAKAELQRAK